MSAYCQGSVHGTTIINPDNLMEGVQTFFTPEIWNRLQEIEKEDLEDGGKCLLLELWTPASMIVMRTVESALRMYYHQCTS
ncbi:MAG: hypothetical protein ACFE9L_18615 [Candidatus Hodarchaeota archaeon]